MKGLRPPACNLTASVRAILKRAGRLEQGSLVGDLLEPWDFVRLCRQWDQQSPVAA